MYATRTERRRPQVVTAGVASKFGIGVHELPAVAERLQALNAEVTGLHIHAGSVLKRL